MDMQQKTEMQDELKQVWSRLEQHGSQTGWSRINSAPLRLPQKDQLQEGHSGCVYAIQLKGKWLVSGGRDRTIRVWDLETRRLRGEPLTLHVGSVLCLRFDPDENEDVIISGSTDASMIVWQFSTGKVLHSIEGAHESSILNLQFNSKYVFTSSKDKTIKIWNRHELSPLSEEYPRIPNGSNTSVTAHVIDVASVSPSLIEAGLADGLLRILQPYTQVATFHGHTAAVNTISTHGDLLVSGSGDRTARIWNIVTGQCSELSTGHTAGIACLQFDGRYIVSGSSDNSIRIHDINSLDASVSLLGHSNIVRTLQADFGGMQRLAPNMTQAGLLRAEGRQESTMFVQSEVQPKIVSGSYDGSVIIWKQGNDKDWHAEQNLRPMDMYFTSADEGRDVKTVTTQKEEDIDQEDKILVPRVFDVKFDSKRIVCSGYYSQIYYWEFAAQ